MGQFKDSYRMGRVSSSESPRGPRGKPNSGDAL
jgi:hypothetical protein